MTHPQLDHGRAPQLGAWLRLHALAGSREGQCKELLEDESIVIGREPNSDLVLNDRGVSRQHGRIEFVKSQWRIEDLGSTNGLQLLRAASGQRLDLKSTSMHLEHGDEIVVGEARLRIELPVCTNAETDLLVPQQPVVETELLVPASSANSNPMRSAQTRTRSQELIPNAEHPSAVHANFYSALTTAAGPSAPRLPYRFRNYQIEKKIGEGGMGEVFLASALGKSSSSRELAIKFLRNQHGISNEDRARFIREMEISAQLKHVSIVECVDCGEEDGQAFIVMPFCSGGNLAELLKRTGKLNLRRSLRLLDRLLAGVEHAHRAGIVHRDLKPFNVLLAKDSQNKYLPKISDFGLAKSYLLAGESGMTVNGTVGGSWAYMPKEQLTNFRFVSPQSDVWSLGAIVYECLTGELPRPMKPGADPIRVILASEIVAIDALLPSVPKRVARFIMKALSPETVERYTDAGQMRAALRVAAGHEQIEL